MVKIPLNFTSDYNFEDTQYLGFQLEDLQGITIQGNDCKINGNNKVAHLLHIYNSNAEINDLTFSNGDTNLVYKLSRKEIYFRKNGTIFEIIDGGAVLITGNSNVTFNNCQFISNKALMCGGAVSNQSSGKVTFNNCLFEDNSAGHTGGAIDNLTTDSDIEVKKCKFITNKSNTWNQSNAPHGQITLFPKTSAVISNSLFKFGSIPYDYHVKSHIETRDNIYQGYGKWSKSTTLRRRGFSIKNTIITVIKLYTIILKVLGNVKCRINASKW